MINYLVSDAKSIFITHMRLVIVKGHGGKSTASHIQK